MLTTSGFGFGFADEDGWARHALLDNGREPFDRYRLREHGVRALSERLRDDALRVVTRDEDDGQIGLDRPQLFDGRVVKNFRAQLGRAEVAFEDETHRKFLVLPIAARIRGTAAALNFETAVHLENFLAIRQPHFGVDGTLIALLFPPRVNARVRRERGVDGSDKRHDRDFR